MAVGTTSSGDVCIPSEMNSDCTLGVDISDPESEQH